MMKTLSLVELLRSVEYALNAIPCKKLRGDPNGIEDTYELAKHVEEHLYFRSPDKGEAQ